VRGFLLAACLAALLPLNACSEDAVSYFQAGTPADRSAVRASGSETRSAIVTGSVPCAANQAPARMPGGSIACTARSAPPKKTGYSPGASSPAETRNREFSPAVPAGTERRTSLGSHAAPVSPGHAPNQAPRTGTSAPSSEPGADFGPLTYSSSQEGYLDPCADLYQECSGYFLFVCKRTMAAADAGDEDTVQRLLGTMTRLKTSCLREARSLECVEPDLSPAELRAECPL